MRNRILRIAPEERAAKPLWDGNPPGAIGSAPEDVPTYSLYLPQAGKAGRHGVVVFPGGGYVTHAEHEAGPVGRWLRNAGIPAMVARYRLGPRYTHPAMLVDARQAIRRMRKLCAEFGIEHVGVLGFSAGGHLAGMAAILPDEAQAPADRPDFAILIYPVICMSGPYAHEGCRATLLGRAEVTEQAERLSLERRVTPETPPLFLVHGADDAAVPVGNSLSLALVCQQLGVPCELHVFQEGAHGFGLGDRGRPNRRWPGLCLDWLRSLP